MSKSEQIIPKKIFQSWKKKTLPDAMARLVQETKEMNPEYEYIFYDDTDCRQFLEQHFGAVYANAFDSLSSGAYKCDFWRYAVLYVYGGVYMDLDMKLEVPLRQIIDPKNTLVTVVDKTTLNLTGIYQAFVACTPGHPVMLTSLQLTFGNIVTHRPAVLGDVLAITGPAVVAVALNLYWKRDNTNARIQPGIYDGGKTKLLKNDKDSGFVIDENAKKLIYTKVRGSVPSTYGFGKSFYHNDPYNKIWRIYIGVVMSIIGLGIIFLLLFFIYRRKWKSCEKSCSTA